MIEVVLDLIAIAILAAFRQVAVDMRAINREEHHPETVGRTLEWATTIGLLLVGLKFVLWVIHLA